MPPVAVAEFIFRALLNFFFSGALGFVCWVIGRVVFISFLQTTPVTNEITFIVSIGIGTGIGGSAGTLMLGLSNLHLALRIVSIVAVAMIGGWVGSVYGETVYVPAGMPGIPELAGIVWGAMIAANGLPIALDTIAAIRRHRMIHARRGAGE